MEPAIRFDDTSDHVEVEVDDADKKESKVVYDDMAVNLVPVFEKTDDGKEALKRISHRVRDDFDTAWDSAEEYRERQANDWRIFAGELPPKTFPFKDSANPHIPIMLENISRLCFRAFGEIFGDWSNVYGFSPLNPGADKIAEVLTIHGNWQIRSQIPDFRRQMHRGILSFFSIGDVTSHSFYDDVQKHNVHEILTCDEFVTPYSYTTTSPNYADLPFYCKILQRYRHELQRMKDEWSGIDEILENRHPSWSDEPEMQFAEATQDIQGIHKPESDERAPYKLIWYEGWIDLPNQDRDRFCQCIVDQATGGILKLCIHEQENWQDRQRFDAQMAELEQYNLSQELHQQAMEKHALLMADVEARLVAGALDPAGHAAEKQTLEAATPQPPPKPIWMNESQEPKPVRMEPIRLFAHGVCIEPMRGNLGLSYGRIQADLNRAANVATSQYVDAATMNNVKVFLTASNVEMPADFSISPGKFHNLVGVSPGELAGSIMPLDAGPPSDGLMRFTENAYEWAQAGIQSPNVFSGEPGKSGETFRGINARIEQATKQLQVPTQKYVDFLTEILKNNSLLNSIYLPDEEMVLVADMPTIPEGNEYIPDPMAKLIKVGRWMYEKGYAVEVRADLRFVPQQQRVQEADEVLMTIGQHPMMRGNVQFQLAALKKSLEARGRRDLVALLAPPPPPPQPGPPGGGPPPSGGPPGAPPGPPGAGGPPPGPPPGPIAPAPGPPPGR